MKKISVLLVDDHQMLLDLWSVILTKDGRFEITGKATNGTSAIELAKLKRPDVAVIDINMGNPDGFETTKEIRRLSPATKIIGMSMYVMPAYAKKMKAAGAVGYVTKSSPADEMITAIIEVYTNGLYFCEQIKNLLSQEESLSLNKDGDTSLLTCREIEVLQLIKKGLTTPQIAEQLYLSPKTINIHRYSLFRKLNVNNLASFMAVAQTIEL
jgi:DNA-binding NarL/FixJ family response regulator